METNNVKTKRKLLPYFVGVPLFFVWLWSGPFIYFGTSIEGRVIDAETNAPLEGVVVVLQWGLSAVLGDGGHGGETVYHTDTITNKDGNYKFSAWGPRIVGPFNQVTGWEPEITLYKRGYKPIGLNSHRRFNGGFVLFSDRDGETIKLEKFKGSLIDYKNAIGSLSTAISIHSSSNYSWKKTPHIVAAIIKEREFLSEKGLLESELLGLIDYLDLYGDMEKNRQYLSGYENE